jgi:hypothetical protein
MKAFEQTTETRSVKTCIVHECDLCHKNMMPPYRSQYVVDEATVKLRQGNIFPEGRLVNVQEVDICGDCMEAVVFPFLVEKGAKIRETSED